MNELIKIEEINPIDLFLKKESDSVISRIEEIANEFKADVDSEAGRAEIRSFAYKIARSKTALDDLGKELVFEWKEKVKSVDSERKKLRERLDEIKDRVRLPLTEYEARETRRIQEIEEKLKEIENLQNLTATSDDVEAVEQFISGLVAGLGERRSLEWQEYNFKAQELISKTIEILEEKKRNKIQYIKDQAELAELRALKAKQEEEAISKAREEFSRCAEEMEVERQLEKEEFNEELDICVQEEAKDPNIFILENIKKYFENKEKAKIFLEDAIAGKIQNIFVKY